MVAVAVEVAAGGVGAQGVALAGAFGVFEEVEVPYLGAPEVPFGLVVLHGAGFAEVA